MKVCYYVLPLVAVAVLTINSVQSAQAPKTGSASKDNSDIKLVEDLLVARTTYERTLVLLHAHYVGAGDSEKAKWAEDELRAYHRTARIAMGAGCDVILAKGETLNPLSALSGGARHTLFKASLTPAAARKRWIAGVLRPEGALMIDEGAVRALNDGKSLLPAGIRQIDGRFERGDAVLVKDRDGREVARGLVAYNASDAERIAGKRTVEIEAILGYRGRDEMIHRDDLVLTGNGT